MRFGPIAAALVLAAAASPALAQNVPDQPAGAAPAPSANPVERFQAYVQLDGYKSMLSQMATVGETVSAPECKEHKAVSHTIMAVFVPPAFADGLHPIQGVWLDRAVMQRCGIEVFQNVLFQARAADKPPAAALLLPGATATIPPKQAEVMKDVLDGLAKKNCSDQSQIIPVNTKRDKEIKPLKIDEKGKVVEGAWKETWTLKACGKTVNATVDLTADGKGGLAHKVKL